MGSLHTLRAAASAKHREERSLFIAEIVPTVDADECACASSRLRRRYPDAAHYPSAYRLWLSGEIVEQAGDDGEPPGTAGRPILDALRRAGLVGVFLGVARYFGGRKLGTRRLADSFALAARGAIEKARPVEVVRSRILTVRFPHDLTGSLFSLVERMGGQITARSWGERVDLTATFPVNRADDAAARISEVLRGRGTLRIEADDVLLPS